MTKAKHTPGPWYITQRDDGIFRVREYESDAVLANVDDGGHVDEFLINYDAQEANALLIAAAPDLLAELEKLAAWVGGVLNEQPSVNQTMQKDWENAINLLAKAKGETE